MSLSLIDIIVLYSAIYLVIIALIYLGIQIYYFLAAIDKLMPSLNRISILLESAKIKGNYISNYTKEKVDTISSTYGKFKTIYDVLGPYLFPNKAERRVRELEKKLKKIEQQVHDLD